VNLEEIEKWLNVFVTENTVGDVDYYKSLGIVIKAGITYNIGKFIEWCLANELGLIGYPEGLEEEKINYVNVLDRTEYTFTLQTKSLKYFLIQEGTRLGLIFPAFSTMETDSLTISAVLIKDRNQVKVVVTCPSIV
jgi:hypothetical protein